MCTLLLHKTSVTQTDLALLANRLRQCRAQEMMPSSACSAMAVLAADVFLAPSAIEHASQMLRLAMFGNTNATAPHSHAILTALDSAFRVGYDAYLLLARIHQNELLTANNVIESVLCRTTRKPQWRALAEAIGVHATHMPETVRRYLQELSPPTTTNAHGQSLHVSADTHASNQSPPLTVYLDCKTSMRSAIYSLSLLAEQRHTPLAAVITYQCHSVCVAVHPPPKSDNDNDDDDTFSVYNAVDTLCGAWICSDVAATLCEYITTKWFPPYEWPCSNDCLQTSGGDTLPGMFYFTVFERV
jgi:hypothetical protein